MSNNVYVPIIMGSDKDIPHCDKIRDELNKFGVKVEYRICSAHKSGVYLLNMLKSYEEDINVLCVVTVAGRSNALSAFTDGHFTKPVIANPPLNNGNIHNLHSSTSMPSGVSPLVILGASNCALAVVKLLSVKYPEFRRRIMESQINVRHKLRIIDIINKNRKVNRRRNTVVNNISDDLSLIRSGKVRDLYRYDDDHLLMSATNKLTAFDRKICTIKHKGSVLNKISVWWFNETKNLVPNHFVREYNDTDIVVKECHPFLIEFVVRGYITGSSKTSMWTNYNNGVRQYCGHHLPDGLVKNQKLPQVLLTPTTKGETDELISMEEIVRRGIMTQEEWNRCEKYALTLFNHGQKVANNNGLILVDTKYEFGIDKSGRIILIDEVHTPDSSRYWFKHSYEERFNNGLDPQSIDKEIIRKWIKQNYNPYNLDENIVIPEEYKNLVSDRYLQLYEIITGNEL